MVVDSDGEPIEGPLNDWFHLAPPTPSQGTADPRHVDAGLERVGIPSDPTETSLQRVVPDRWPLRARLGSGLGNHVHDCQMWLNHHELSLPELESPGGLHNLTRLWVNHRISLVMPFTIHDLGPLPLLGDGQDKTGTPTPEVVANVEEELRPSSKRIRGVPMDEGDHGKRLHRLVYSRA